MIHLATTIGPAALMNLGRVALLAAVIFATLRWRGVAIARAIAASLVFARAILFLMSGSLYALVRYNHKIDAILVGLSNIAPVCLIAWLLVSSKRTAAWMLAIFEIGVLAIGGTLMVSAATKDARIGVPLLEIAAASVPVRLAILVAAIAVATRRALPSSGARAR